MAWNKPRTGPQRVLQPFGGSARLQAAGRVEDGPVDGAVPLVPGHFGREGAVEPALVDSEAPESSMAASLPVVLQPEAVAGTAAGPRRPGAPAEPEWLWGTLRVADRVSHRPQRGTR